MTSAAYSSQSAREKGTGDVQYWLPVTAMPPTSEPPRQVTLLICPAAAITKGASQVLVGRLCAGLELTSEQEVGRTRCPIDLFARRERLSAGPLGDAFLIVF